MIDGGLTPMEGIVAATSDAAEALGLGDVGAVVPGAAADLVVLDGDPLSEPAILLDADRIHLVVQGGEILAAAPRRR
jgi:imidazolonepropionase-like amidohydrolase